MKTGKQAVSLACISILVVLITAFFGVKHLWRSMISYHVSVLNEQIESNLNNELSEGNLFGVSSALGRLRMAGILNEIALVQIGNTNHWIFTSSNEFRHELERVSSLDSLCRQEETGVVFTSDNRLVSFGRVPVSTSEESCVIAESRIPRELTAVKNTFLLVLLVIVSMSIIGITWLFIRLGRRERDLEVMAAKEKLRLVRALADQALQVAHDIRSPLAALSLAVNSESEIGYEQRDIIKRASDRITSIANDLIGRSRVSDAQTIASDEEARDSSPMKLETLIIGELLKEIYQEKKMEYSSLTGLELVLSEDGPFNSQCRLDKKEFCRSISNLVNNSVESLSSDEGKVTLAVRDAQSQIAVLIIDTGRGIPPELLSQLGNQRISFGKTGTSGSGLGFIHARTAIESMGGRISVQSRVGAGTIISIYLPRNLT